MTFPFHFEKFIDQINMTLTTYGFIVNLMNIADEMEDGSHSNVMKAVGISLIFCFLVYVMLGFLCLNIYGNTININVFINLHEDTSALSYITRCLFLILFFVGLPFLFFPIKQSTLTLIREFEDNVFSKKMERQIKMYRGALDAEDNNGFIKENKVKDVNPMTDASDRLFYLVCAAWLIINIAVSCLVDDLSLVFGVVGSWNESMLNFIFPGIFFI